MKKIWFVLVLFCMACASEQSQEEQMKSRNHNERVIAISVDKQVYEVTLIASDASEQFIQQLPLQLSMEDLNNNEKFAYLKVPISSKPKTMSQIKKGDLMLYGEDCLVLFYEDNSSNYAYTKLAHIEDLDELDSGNIFVKIQPK